MNALLKHNKAGRSSNIATVVPFQSFVLLLTR